MRTWKAVVLGVSIGLALGLIIGFLGGLLISGLLSSPQASQVGYATPGSESIPSQPSASDTPAPVPPPDQTTIEEEAWRLYEQEMQKHYSQCGDSWFAQAGSKIHEFRFVEGPRPKLSPSQVTRGDEANGIEWHGWVRVGGKGIERTYLGDQWTTWRDFSPRNEYFGVRLQRKNGKWEIASLGAAVGGLSPIDCDRIPAE